MKKSLLDANRVNHYTSDEVSLFCLIDENGVKDYMKDEYLYFWKEVYRKFTGREGTNYEVISIFDIHQADIDWDVYTKEALNQILKGNYAENVNLLGTLDAKYLANTAGIVLKEIDADTYREILESCETVAEYKRLYGGSYNNEVVEDIVKRINNGELDGEVSTELVGEVLEKIGNNIDIIKFDLNNLPQNVQDAFKKYDDSGWRGNVAGQTQGTKAGGTYLNKNGKLPTMDEDNNPITYKEWDINNKQPGMDRDGERFVTGSDGSIYYTDSHYGEGVSLNGLPAFVKIR